MLVLTRKPMQRIRISDSIEIVVLGIRGGRAQIGIECSANVPVMRAELLKKGMAQDAAVEVAVGGHV